MVCGDLSSHFQCSWCVLFPASLPSGPWWITDAWLLAEGNINRHRMKCLPLWTWSFMFTVWTKKVALKMIYKCWCSFGVLGAIHLKTGRRTENATKQINKTCRKYRKRERLCWILSSYFVVTTSFSTASSSSIYILPLEIMWADCRTVCMLVIYTYIVKVQVLSMAQI